MESPEEKAKRLGVPMIHQVAEKPKVDPNPVVAVCGACGMEIRRVMYLSCQYYRCPVQLKWTL